MSVTVVVPTFNRDAFVRDVVSALQAQTHADFQAVLVDDGSSDDTAEIAASVTRGDPRFTVLSTPNRGPASARNRGCAEVATDWIAFTDDDCLPQAGWLASLLETAASASADVVQGRTLPDPTIDRAALPWYSRSQHIGAWSGRFQTCNLLVRSACFARAGGFDESFPPDGFGEDTDLGLRLVRAGATTAFAVDAVVHHRILPMTYLEFIRRRYRWAKVVRLVAVNPDSRAVFPYPYVAYRAHLVFWAALPLVVWAVLSRRWLVVAGGVLAFGIVRARGSKDKGRSAVIRTAWGATELPGLAGAAVGFLVESVRHRRLLL